MITIHSDVRDELLLAESRPLTVYEIAFSTHTMYLSSQAVTWGGNDYEARVVRSSPVIEEMGKRANEVTLTLDNSSRFLIPYLEPEDRLTGVRITIRLLMRDASMVPKTESHVVFLGVAQKPKNVKGNNITVIIRRIDDRRDLAAPRRSPHVSCPFTFKDGVNCNYVGVETTCTRLLDDCTTYARLHEHGGFPGEVYQGQTGAFIELIGAFLENPHVAKIVEDSKEDDDEVSEFSVPILYGRKMIQPSVFQSGVMVGTRVHSGRFMLISEGEIEGVVNWYDADEFIEPRTNTYHLTFTHPNDSLFYRPGVIGVTGTDDYEADWSTIERPQNIDPFSPDAIPYSRTAYATHIQWIDTVGSDPEDYQPPYLDVKGIKCLRYDSGGVPLVADGGPVWTRNPVWHALDFLFNERYGIGDVITTADIDWAVTVATAAYCDEEVTGNPVTVSARVEANIYTVDDRLDLERGMTIEYDDGTTQTAGEVVRIIDDVTVELDIDPAYVSSDTITPKIPRFTNDMYITSKSEASKVLRNILASCRGFIVMRDEGKLAIRIERDVASSSGAYADWQEGTIEVDDSTPVVVANGTPTTNSRAVTADMYRVELTFDGTGRQYATDRHGNVITDHEGDGTDVLVYATVEASDATLKILFGGSPTDGDSTSMSKIRAWPLITAAPRGIVKDSLDWITTDADEGVNRITGGYTDPDGKSERVEVTDWDHAATHPLKSKSLNSSGTDNRDQAYRLAEVELAKRRTLRTGGKCTLSPISLELELGDIIYTTHNEPSWYDRLKRVVKVERYGLGDQKELCTRVTLSDYDATIYPGGLPPERHHPLAGAVTVTLTATNVNGQIELNWTPAVTGTAGPLLGFIVLKSDATIAGDFSNGTILARRLRQTSYTYTPTEAEYGETLYFTVVARFARASRMSNEVSIEALGITATDMDPTTDADREGIQLVAYGSFQAGWDRVEVTPTPHTLDADAADVGGGYTDPTQGNNGSTSDYASAAVSTDGTTTISHIYSISSGTAALEGHAMAKLGGIKGRYGRQNAYYSVDAGSSWVLFDSHIGSLKEVTSGALVTTEDQFQIKVETTISGPAGQSATGRTYDCAFMAFDPPYSGIGAEGADTYGYLVSDGITAPSLARPYPGVDPTPFDIVHAANSENVIQLLVRAPDGTPTAPLTVLIRDTPNGINWSVASILASEIGTSWGAVSALWVPVTDVVGDELEIVIRSNSTVEIQVDQVAIHRGSRIRAWTPHRDEIGFTERPRVLTWANGKWTATNRSGTV